MAASTRGPALEEPSSAWGRVGKSLSFAQTFPAQLPWCCPAFQRRDQAQSEGTQSPSGRGSQGPQLCWGHVCALIAQGAPFPLLPSPRAQLPSLPLPASPFDSDHGCLGFLNSFLPLDHGISGA